MRNRYDSRVDMLAADIADLVKQRETISKRDAGPLMNARRRRRWREEFRQATSLYRAWEQVYDDPITSRELEERLNTRAERAMANGSTLVDSAPSLPWTAVSAGLHTAAGPNCSAVVQASPTSSRNNWSVIADGKQVASGSHRSVTGAKRMAERAVKTHIVGKVTGQIDNFHHQANGGWTPLT
jgi:hypothetical protein